jgi:hypothetical protein
MSFGSFLGFGGISASLSISKIFNVLYPNINSTTLVTSSDGRIVPKVRTTLPQPNNGPSSGDLNALEKKSPQESEMVHSKSFLENSSSVSENPIHVVEGIVNDV